MKLVSIHSKINSHLLGATISWFDPEPDNPKSHILYNPVAHKNPEKQAKASEMFFELRDYIELTINARWLVEIDVVVVDQDCMHLETFTCSDVSDLHSLSRDLFVAINAHIKGKPYGASFRATCIQTFK